MSQVDLPGNVTSVLRIGDTVRRSTGPNSPAVHLLLQHLSVAGFVSSPRFLGVDDSGREILDFIHGESPHALEYDGAMLQRTGEAIRRLHECTASFVLPAGIGWMDPPGGDGALVICHNDLAPRNTVIRSDGTIAFIDWDGACPAPREWDLAHAIWQYGYIGPVAVRERGIAHAEGRIAALLDGYGRDGFDASQVVDLYIPVTQRTLEAIARYVDAGTLRGAEPLSWMQDIREQHDWARANDSWLRQACSAMQGSRAI